MKYLVLKTNWGYGGNVYREKGEIVDLDETLVLPPTIFKPLEARKVQSESEKKPDEITNDKKRK